MANLSSTRIFGDGTVERSLYVKQRLGVGVGNPSAKVQAQSSGTIGGSGNLSNANFLSGNTSTGIGIDNNEITKNGGDLYLSATSGNIQFRTNNGNERMRIESGGNVGIGTNSPSAGLEVQSTGKFSGRSGTALGIGDISNSDSAFLTFEQGDGSRGTIGLDSSDLDIVSGSGNILLRSNSGGNVGIGTTSPNNLLDVAGNAEFRNGADKLYVGNFADIDLEGRNGSYPAIAADNVLRVGARMEIWGNANGRYFDVRDSSGNVGGKVNAEGDSYFGNNGNNVGIGTTSPAQKLDVENGHINLTDGYSLGWGGSRSTQIDTNTTIDNLRFVVTGTEAMNIRGSGNVGIGTTSPSVKLDVDGTVYVNSTIANRNDAGQERLTLQTDGVLEMDRQLEFKLNSDGSRATGSVQWTFVAAGNEKMRIQEDGNVGIGTTSPEHQLTVEGNNAVASLDGTTTNGTPMLHIGESDNYGVGFRWDAGLNLDIVQFDGETITNSGGTKVGHFRVRDKVFYWSGNVGIGTTSPDAKLDVNGTIYADGDVIAYYSSDRRLKDNATQIQNPMSKIENFTGVGFDWKEEASRDGSGFGIFAQDAKKIDERLVREQGDGYLGVDYQQLHAFEIEALKQVNEKVEENQSEIQRLKQRIAKLESNDNAI